MSGSSEIDPAIFDPSMFDINSFDPNNIVDPNIFVQNLNLNPFQLEQVLKLIKHLYVRVNYKRNSTEDKIKDLVKSHDSLDKTCNNECLKCNNRAAMQTQISTLKSQLPNFSAQLRTLEKIEHKIEERIPVAFKATQMAEVHAKASDYIVALREQSESFDNNPSREGYDLALQTYAKLKPIVGKLNEQMQHEIMTEINPILMAMYKHLVEEHEQANPANPANQANTANQANPANQDNPSNQENPVNQANQANPANQANQANPDNNNQLRGAGKKRSKSKKSSRKTKPRKSRKSRKTKSRRH